MGAPEEDIWRIKAWTDAWVQRLGMMQTEEEERWSVEMEIEAQNYFQPIFERLRQEPDDTLLSEMVNRVIPEWGRPLNDNELHAEMMADTFVGGSETSTNAISAGVMLLIQNPEAWRKLKSDPDKYLKTFVEEVVRLEPPFKFHYRSVRRPCRLAGFDLEPGDRLMLLWASANRDSETIEDPDDLRLDRRYPKRHLSFGRGSHFCIGAPLARLETRVMVEELLERCSSLRLRAGARPRYARSIFVRRLERLELEVN